MSAASDRVFLLQGSGKNNFPASFRKITKQKPKLNSLRFAAFVSFGFAPQNQNILKPD